MTTSTTPTTETALHFEVIAARDFPNEWIVEAIDRVEGDGVMIRFSGTNARRLAEEYAEWKNAG